MENLLTPGACCRAPAITVLFVDDDADTRFAYQLIGTERGLKVEVAGDGHEALVIASALTPDVIVLDVGLGRGELDGLEVARRLRADSNTSAIPIVVVSGSANVRHEAEVKAIGCEGHLVKPCSADGLLELVTALARSRTDRATSIDAVV